MQKPELKISVFSDYICPFCYVGNKRLKHLNQYYDVKINWCFIEIHPETPLEGKPLENLPYSESHWNKLKSNLETMASEDDLSLLKQSITANSHNAILFAEACKVFGREIFYQVHDALFESFFEQGINIGQPEALINIAQKFDIKEQFVVDALNSPEMERHLPIFQKWAAKLNISSVPSFVFGDRVLTGAVSKTVLKEAADELYLKSKNQ